MSYRENTVKYGQNVAQWVIGKTVKYDGSNKAHSVIGKTQSSVGKTKHTEL